MIHEGKLKEKGIKKFLTIHLHNNYVTWYSRATWQIYSPQKTIFMDTIDGGYLSTHTHTHSHSDFSVTCNLIIVSTQNISVLPFFFLICKKCNLAGFTSQLQKAGDSSCATFSHTFRMNMLNSFKCHSQSWRLLRRLEAQCTCESCSEKQAKSTAFSWRLHFTPQEPVTWQTICSVSKNESTRC